jgi:hypothetical protein
MRHGYNAVNDEREPLSGQSAKPMPPNTTWLFAHFLPFDLTDTELQKFFAEIGLGLPLENFAVTPHSQGTGCNAVIGIPQSTISMLVNWAINKVRLRGTHAVEVKEARSKGGK